MGIAETLHDYNMEVIRLRRIQIRTSRIRVKKKIQKRLLKLKVRAVSAIDKNYLWG